MYRIISIAFLFSSLLISAQRTEFRNKGKRKLLLEKHQVNFNFLSPGIKYEIGLFKNVSASTSLGLGLASYQDSYSLAPTLNVMVKQYHNLERRLEKGKNISHNSGNFVAFSFNNYFTRWQLAGNIDKNELNLISYGLVYGIQRSYDNGISFEIEAGPGSYRRLKGVGQGYEGVGGGLIFNFSFGWTPAKRKNKLIEWLNSEPK